MSQSFQNSSDDFNELNTKQLEKYAKKWVQNYPEAKIERVVLYEYDLYKTHDLHGYKFRPNKFRIKGPIPIYAIVFEFAGCQNISVNKVKYYPNDEDDACTRFIKEVKFAGQYGGPHPFIDRYFRERIYKKDPVDNFYREWQFIPQKIGEKPDSLILEKNAYRILYQHKPAEFHKKKKLTHAQKCKNACRELAKKIWDKDPHLTIQDLCKHPEILKVSKHKNDKLYIEGTIRNWIKDLCPNRSPGRRKIT